MQSPLVLNQPNTHQLIALSQLTSSPSQPRLFIEREGLVKLRDIYTRYSKDKSVVLPDPPIVRYMGPGKKLEVLAGHRRIQAASEAELTHLPCRVVQMTDQEVYEFVLAHNDVKSLTTVELAYRAAEMDRLGYDAEEISDHLGGLGSNRYIAVGQYITPNDFDDRPKLCDPGITTWYEAALHGEEHFRTCFKAWNTGQWGEEQCKRYFRKRGKILPLDNNEKGLRITVSRDGRKLQVRGRLDLDLHTPEEVEEISAHFVREFETMLREYSETGDFGGRQIININPDTLP